MFCENIDISYGIWEKKVVKEELAYKQVIYSSVFSWLTSVKIQIYVVTLFVSWIRISYLL